MQMDLNKCQQTPNQTERKQHMIRSFVQGEEPYIIQSHYAYYNKEHQFDLSFKQFIQAYAALR